MSSYVFESVEQLVCLLYKWQKSSISPLKLQKGLYFLYAYYAAMYGNQTDEGNNQREIMYDFPKELFPAEFEAWDYGPVIRQVYFERRDKELELIEKSKKFDESSVFNSDNEDIKMFISDLWKQIQETSDFSLVDRSHEDEAWRNAYDKPYSERRMSNEEIINEYQAKFIKGE